MASQPFTGIVGGAVVDGHDLHIARHGDCSNALSPAVSMKPPWLYVAIRTVTLCRLPVVVGLPT